MSLMSWDVILFVCLILNYLKMWPFLLFQGMTSEDLGQLMCYAVNRLEIVQQTHSQDQRVHLCICLELILRYQNTSALTELNKMSFFGNIMLTKKPYLLWKKNYVVIQVSGKTAFFFLMLTSNIMKTSSYFICLCRSNRFWSKNILKRLMMQGSFVVEQWFISIWSYFNLPLI